MGIPSLPPGDYEHYKGKHYRVLGVGCHTETNEYYVVYAPLYAHEGQPDMWIRPYEMFLDTVSIDGEEVPRFKYLTGDA